MLAAIEQVNISRLAPKPKPIQEEVAVGKDILELLAGSMYIDPLNIYREYIQNAADAIDLAQDNALGFEEKPGIQIEFDHVERVIRIRDNGIGIPANEFVKRLTTIGASQKRGKNLRGFRGVGRLSGLGYCQELIFRGRVKGESKITEIRWNGRLLRDKLRDPAYIGDLNALVKDVVTEVKLAADDYPARFFEVELRKVARLRNDILLNEEVVRSYISQIAPVPFMSTFSFGEKIMDELAAIGIRPPIHIELLDGKGGIFHRVQDEILFSATQVDKIEGIEFVNILGTDGEPCAFGWIANHSYMGAVPKKMGLGGIRLRIGNIQVGDEMILAPLFPESRFASWTIGEIHIISSKIMPNSRRDDFEPSIFYAHLQNELILKAKSIAQRIRENSNLRNQLNIIRQNFENAEEWLNIASERDLPTVISENFTALVKNRLAKATKEVLKIAPETKEGINSRAQLDILTNKFNEMTFNKNEITPAISTKFAKPISIAMRTILLNAKSPNLGIDLCLEVLSEIKNDSEN